MAEQAINTIYLLGEQPDALCSDMLKHLTAKVFAGPTSNTTDHTGIEGEGASDPPSTPMKNKPIVPETPFTVGAFEPEPTPMPAGRKSSDTPDLGTQMSLGSQARDDSETPAPSASLEQGAGGGDSSDVAPAFQLAQLVFAVGHVAVKHIVYLELVEREFKRRKDANAKGMSATFNELWSGLEHGGVQGPLSSRGTMDDNSL
jgi:condensin complex subunit 1